MQTRDLPAELLFEGHDQLDGVEGIGTKVVEKGRLRGDLLFVNVQLVNDDFFDALFDSFLVGHDKNWVVNVW